MNTLSAPFRYVPLLKGKEGEYRALRRLTLVERSLMRPLIDVPPVPRGADPEHHYEQQFQRLRVAWRDGGPVFVDSRLVQPGLARGGVHPGTILFHGAANANLPVIPATGLRREDAYQEAVRTVAGARGACIRLEDADLDRQLSRELARLLDRLGVRAEEVDLVLDYRDAVAGAPRSLAVAAAAVIGQLPRLARWRTLTLASGAFPRDLGAVRNGEVHRLPRSDLAFWEDVTGRLGAGTRRPAFGDYAVAHPDLQDVEGPQVNVPVALRYTTASEFLVMKAGTLRTVGGRGFRALCARLVEMPEYSGSAFSWGDGYIDESARGETNGGNASTWRQVGTSHHLTLTVMRLREREDSATPRGP